MDTTQIHVTAERNEQPGCEGWQGRVVLDGGRITLGVSRLDYEQHWTVDSKFQGSLPIYVNGYGSRCTRVDQISDPQIIAQLDKIAGLQS